MTEPLETDAADRDWFRSHVDPVLDAGAGPSGDAEQDAWARIADQAGGGGDELAAARSRPTRRWLAAAAVLVAVVGAGALAASRRDGGSSVVTGSSAEGTGWYVPVGLPDGWTVRSATADVGSAACAAWGTEWTKPGAGSISLIYDECRDDYQADADARDRVTTVLSNGTTATGPWYAGGPDHGGGPRVLHWEQDGYWTVRGGGITDDEAIAVAEAAIADPHRADVPVPGFDLVSRWSRLARDATPSVTVQVEAPSGRLGTYVLMLPGTEVSQGGWMILEPISVAGQSLGVVKMLAPPPVNGSSGWSSYRYQGRWPGADVRADRVVEEDHEDDAITDAELEVLVGALRPASAEDWRAFLQSVSKVSPDLRSATTLAGLGRSAEPTTTAVAGPITTEPTTTTTPPATTNPSATEPVTSGPGTSIPHAQGNGDRSTDLAGLEVRMRVARSVVRSGDTVPVTLVMRNTTEHDIEITECTATYARWGLLPADDDAAALPDYAGDRCTGLSAATIPKGTTVDVPLAWRDPPGLVAQRSDESGTGRFLGTLPGGRYRAVVVLPGRDFDLHLEVPVEVEAPSCPTDDELISRFLGLSEAEAQEAAERGGRTVRVASIDRQGQPLRDDLRCDRINLDLVAGRVANAVAY